MNKYQLNFINQVKEHNNLSNINLYVGEFEVDVIPKQDNRLTEIFDFPNTLTFPTSISDNDLKVLSDISQRDCSHIKLNESLFDELTSYELRLLTIIQNVHNLSEVWIPNLSYLLSCKQVTKLLNYFVEQVKLNDKLVINIGEMNGIYDYSYYRTNHFNAVPYHETYRKLHKDNPHLMSCNNIHDNWYLELKEIDSLLIVDNQEHIEFRHNIGDVIYALDRYDNMVKRTIVEQVRKDNKAWYVLDEDVQWHKDGRYWGDSIEKPISEGYLLKLGDKFKDFPDLYDIYYCVRYNEKYPILNEEFLEYQERILNNKTNK